jgi:hypothetical protein
VLGAGSAALIAQVAFWCLVAVGIVGRSLSARAGVIFVVLWLAGFALRLHLPYGVGVFPAYVAALDVGLVLAVFKGDVKLW